MAEAKHSFVDDNPYLVYSPNAEATSEGGSGGGINIVYVTSDAENAYPSMSAEEICESAKAGNLVIFRAVNSENNINDYQLVHAEYGEVNQIACFTLVQIVPENGITGSSIIVQSKTDAIVEIEYPSNNG